MSLPVQNPTHNCYRCDYKGPLSLFYRKDENGEYIIDKKNKTNDLIDSSIMNRMNDGTEASRKRIEEYREQTSFHPRILFCPKCGYVNGTDSAVDSAGLDRAVARSERQRARDRAKRDQYTSNGNGCLLLVFLILSFVGAAYNILSF
jgi:hypothetical protein